MSNIVKNDKKLKMFGTHQIRLLAGWEVHVYEHLWVCVRAVWVCERALLHPAALQTVPVREGGAGKVVSSHSCGLSLKQLKYVLVKWMVCSSTTFSLLPKLRQVTLLYPEISLSFPRLEKKHDSPSHKQPMLSDMYITTCTLTHIPKKNHLKFRGLN